MSKNRYQYLETISLHELAKLFKVDESRLCELGFLDEGNEAPPAIFVCGETRFLVRVVERWIDEQMPELYKI